MDTRIIPEGNMAEKAMPPAPHRSEKKAGSISAVARSAGIALLAAEVINGALFFIAKAIGVRFVVLAPNVPGLQAITIASVVAATAVGVVGAAAVFWITARFAKRPEIIFQGISFAVLLASFVPPLSLPPETGAAGKAVLALMHVAVAVTAVPLLLRTLRMR